MKNIYQDKDMSSQENIPSDESESTESGPSASSADQPMAQPVYIQPSPFGQPVYYVPVDQVPYVHPGFRMQQIPLTQDQINMILQQTGMAQPFPQTQFEQEEPGAVDPGTRVLFQSEDFDRSTETDGDYDEEDISFSEEKHTPKSVSVSSHKRPIPVKPSVADDIEIEEETVTLSGNTGSSPKNSSFKVEEMEMSTYELNSILLRQGKSAAYHRPAADRSRDIPLDFSGSFDIEESADEIVEDISSDVKEEREPVNKKKLSHFEIIRRTVLAVAIVAIVISASMLVKEFYLSNQNNKLEEGVSDLIVTDPVTQPTEKEDKKDKDKTTTAAPTPEQQWAAIQKEYPNVIFPMGLQLKYAKLYATNPDFVGYLEAKGVNLSLPVVQTENDTDYMRKNFYGKSTKYGCPFVTHVNNIVDLDTNTIIFGHHMNNGTVFGALDSYKKLDGFKAAPVITFNTLYRDYSWKVVAAFITNAYEKDDNGYVFRYYFASLSTQDRFAAYLNEMSQRSLYDTGVDVLPTDKLLTLSTCSHEFTDARFVVVARLVRPGESVDVDVSKAVVNPNPRYPQAYYSKKKLDNPYKDASRWEVG